MELRILLNAQEAGEMAAAKAAALLVQAVEKTGSARFMAATGASQLLFYEALLSRKVPWEKIEIFHLDEYIGLPESHPASFSHYIKERFISFVQPKAVYYINGMKNPQESLAFLNQTAAERPIDVGMIGFGENAHIAFNDPPADFETTASFKVVELDTPCKQQQVNEGWFPSLADVPQQAISATVCYIQSFEHIVSLIPSSAKAPAVKKILESTEKTPNLPGTALLDHASWFLYLDAGSSSMLDLAKINKFT